MDTLTHIGLCGIVPVVVIENEKDAVPAARALLAGGVDVMEITFRTAAGAAAISAVNQQVPEMLVGAGTVLNTEQARLAVNCGAKFIVSPGFDQDQVAWCISNGISVVPGCVTPTEIMAAMALNLNVLKFFPANVFGGLSGMKALSAPFGKIKFIPTGGVSQDNIGEFSAASFIHAVGGSWICTKADIAAGNFDRITALTSSAVQAMHGFEMAHLGINTPDASNAKAIADTLANGFYASPKDGNSSIFAGAGVEVMKFDYYGDKGHIGFRTNNLPRALYHLQKQGFTPNMDSAKYKGDAMTVVYLNEQVGGFAVHLIQK